jgi:hypothetical protein
MFLPFFDSVWIQIRDGNPMAIALHKRHYSKREYKDGRSVNRIVGPGERIVLITQDAKAVFVWRKFKSMNKQTGINCAVFRNEGAGLSSELILEAEKFAAIKWPGERLYTYVNPGKVKSNNPGYCFQRAGWRKTGMTKKRLLIYEK